MTTLIFIAVSKKMNMAKREIDKACVDFVGKINNVLIIF